MNVASETENQQSYESFFLLFSADTSLIVYSCFTLSYRFETLYTLF